MSKCKSLVTSIFLLSLASCSVFQGRESAGEYVDDASITAKVKESFVADPKVKAMEVNVETMQGVVQLSGFVDTPSTEARAVQLANQVKGVKSVQDDIIVRAPSMKQ